MHSIRVITLSFCALAASAVALRAENRTIDGSNNNESNTDWGSAGSILQRQSAADYADGFSAPSGALRPNPRLVSNTIASQSGLMPNSHALSNWVFQWGQFIDHDISLTNTALPAESLPIAIPMGDEYFDPASTGTQTMAFSRSEYDPSTGTTNPREQINSITSYLDASMIYGSDAVRAEMLRTLDGGRLKTSAGDLLPFNTFGLDNATGGNPFADTFYVAGDVRANEQVGLTAVHTLFLREHNRLADEIAAANVGWSDEQIYQRARKLVGAEIQAITFNEFLPALLGPHAPLNVAGTYNDEVNATTLTEFSTALYRIGHTMLSPQLLRMENDGTPSPGGPMDLRDAFFVPGNMAAEGEVDCILKGLAMVSQQEADMHIVDDVRNFLFGPPIPGGFDLASLNIQRGRDHGLPGYNAVREAFGLPAFDSFDQVTSDVGLQEALASIYDSVDEIDPWVGALVEDHLPGSALGELATVGIAYQFTLLRDGDRFWHVNDADLTSDDLEWLASRSLSDVIRANTDVTNLQANVFFAVPEPSGLLLLSLASMIGVAGRRLSRRHCIPA
jgi:hypothetical protein